MKKRAIRWLGALCGAGVVILAVKACDDGGPGDVAGRLPDELPPVAAANALPPDHPLAEGQYRFLYDAWGAEQYGRWPPAEFMLQLMRDEPEVFGNQFAGFGFVPDPNDEFPFGFKRGLRDPSQVYQTCAACHVAELPDGRVWLGAPNGELDFGRFRAEVNRRWVAAGNPPLLSAHEEAKTRQLGPGRFHAESGDYPKVVPADFPPYFRLGRLKGLNHLGTGKDVETEVHLALNAFVNPKPHEADIEVPFPPDRRIDALVDYMSQIEPPPPPPQDPALVEKGRRVFADAGCGSCHHPDAPEKNGVIPFDGAPDGRDRLPGEDPDWPDGSIHTSGAHRVLIDGDGEKKGLGLDKKRLKLIGFIAWHGLSVRMSDGYRVPPLHGLAYTAPYLHNGSVPTLEDLLKPAAERPETFRRGDFVVDTTRPGNDNRGHEFGVDLTPEERAALVAFLLSR